MINNGRQKTERHFPPLVDKDPYLKPYAAVLLRRIKKISQTEKRLTREGIPLAEFASGHKFFGLHRLKTEWVFREWAPNATAIYLVGEMNQWQEQPSFALKRTDGLGVWEIRFSQDVLRHGDCYRLRLYWPGGHGDRIPAWTRRVVQDPVTLIFNAQVWQPQAQYQWRHPAFRRPSASPLIYEAHVGMAQEEEKIGSYLEFAEKIIPRIVDSGYNTLQLMAVQEHPYYASFGYHVSSFFAACSRFGTPEDLKTLIDTAHARGLAVIMDLVHSHAVANEIEGLSRFDGTVFQYFHDGPRGRHKAWDSRCFDYGKDAVLHFLLSNCRFWLDEYRVDGFRFDGVTSMMYHHHGLGKAFISYDDYFDDSVDEDALVYLALANRLIHNLHPEAITMAEDVSGMPGLAAPLEEGGVGFDYRFAMGVPDHWIRLTKDLPDEQWSTTHLWHELMNRRKEEKTVSYAESHDQALVGDQTLIFRLIGAEIYEKMRIEDESIRVDRGIALHKMIRLITLATAGNGYLNFMGNEFGHPEWVDFPREGNAWSYKYARRQWHLADDTHLKYRYLFDFDREMIALAKAYQILEFAEIQLLHEHSEDKIIAFERAGLLFVFNFHPTVSHTDYRIPFPPGQYRQILNSDSLDFSGQGRLTPDQVHFTLKGTSNGTVENFLNLYIPTRTAIVLERVQP